MPPLDSHQQHPSSQGIEDDYFKIGDSLFTCAENHTDPWLERANSVTLEKESINSATLVGVVYAMMKFVLVCGDYYSHWDYKCLMTGI